MSERQLNHYQEVDKYKETNWKSRIFRPDEKWPEPLKLLWMYKFVLLNAAICSFLAGETSMYGEKMIPWYIVTAGIYIGGRIADRVSSIKIFEAMEYADRLGVEHGLAESNPHLPAKPTSQDCFTSDKNGLDIGYLIPGIIFPPMGIVYGISSLVTSRINTVLREDLERQIDA